MSGTKEKVNLLSTFICLIAALIVLLPLLWVLLTSFKSTADFIQNIWGWPKEFMWENYTRAMEQSNFIQCLWNSVMVTALSLVICLVCSTTTAYAIGRYKFAYRGFANGVYMVSMMIPGVISLIPQYFMLSNMHLLDNRFGLIIVYGLSSVPFAVFTLLGFFQTLPHELEEASLVDGANHYQTFAHIMLPLAQPGLVTVAVVQFIGIFNEYYKAQVYMSTPEKFTIPISLIDFINKCRYRLAYGEIMAANMLMIVPTLVVYCIFRNAIQKGLTAGAVKG